jgi:hypothetical protein
MEALRADQHQARFLNYHHHIQLQPVQLSGSGYLTSPICLNKVLHSFKKKLNLLPAFHPKHALISVGEMSLL